MKAMIVFLFFALIFSRCSDNSVDPQICLEGVVIGKIRSWGGGIAVSMNDSIFSSHEWNGFHNVVEALNVPLDLTPGETIYFFGRPATESESSFAISADGDESNKPIIFVSQFSLLKCPTIED
jgi:hypothetical protein